MAVSIECEEYAQWVFADESGAIDRSVSMCSLIEMPLIVGGRQAASDEFPHMVRLNYIYLSGRLYIIKKAFYCSYRVFRLWSGSEALRRTTSWPGSAARH